MPRAPDQHPTRPPPPASGTVPPGAGCSPGSPVALLLVCPCCLQPITVSLTPTVWATIEPSVVPPHAPVPRPPAAPAPAGNTLQRDGALWDLWFMGRHATLRHQRGLLYAGHMLAHPRTCVKILSLAARYASVPRGRAGLTEVWDEQRGQVVALGREPVLQDAVTSADHAEARRRLQRKAHALQAVIDDPATSDSEKDEAREQRQQIADFLRQESRASRDEYKKAADSVRRAIRRLVDSLLEAEGAAPDAEQVKREFARHLEEHLLRPSRRYSAPAARPAREEAQGCLIYEPPPDVVWVVRQ